MNAQQINQTPCRASLSGANNVFTNPEGVSLNPKCSSVKILLRLTSRVCLRSSAPHIAYCLVDWSDLELCIILRDRQDAHGVWRK